MAAAEAPVPAEMAAAEAPVPAEMAAAKAPVPAGMAAGAPAGAVWKNRNGSGMFARLIHSV